jgi:hypothetical protein
MSLFFKFFQILSLFLVSLCGQESDEKLSPQNLHIKGKLVWGEDGVSLSLRLKEMNFDQIQIACFTLSNKPKKFETFVDASGSFHLSNLPRQTPLECVLLKNEEVLGNLVLSQMTESFLEETYVHESFDDVFELDESLDFGLIVFNELSGLAKIQLDQIVDYELGQPIPNLADKLLNLPHENAFFDPTGLWVIKDTSWGDGFYPLLSSVCSADKWNPSTCHVAENSGLYLKLIEGKVLPGHPRLPANQSYWGLQAWGSLTSGEKTFGQKAFHSCGKKFGFELDHFEHIDFSKKTDLSSGSYDWSKELVVLSEVYPLQILSGLKNALVATEAWNCSGEAPQTLFCHEKNYHFHAVQDPQHCLRRYEFVDERKESHYKPCVPHSHPHVTINVHSKETFDHLHAHIKEPLTRLLLGYGHFVGQDVFVSSQWEESLVDDSSQDLVCPVIKEKLIELRNSTKVDHPSRLLATMKTRFHLDLDSVRASARLVDLIPCQKLVKKMNDEIHAQEKLLFSLEKIQE